MAGILPGWAVNTARSAWNLVVNGVTTTVDIPRSLDNTDQASWHRVMPLGRGSYGGVDLWILLQRDTANNLLIQDRIALKTCSATGSNEYSDEVDWIGKPGTLHAEIAALLAVNSTKNTPKSPFVVDLKGFRVSRSPKYYRLALSVAEYGNILELVLLWHLGQGRRGQVTGDPLPEAFLMDIFLACARAIHHIATRNLNHNDVKPENIVLAADPDNDLHALDPGALWGIKPLIIDFGLAKPLNARRIRLDDHIGVGTDGFRPPEQVLAHVIPTQAAPGYQAISISPTTNVSEKSMIFGLAAAFVRLLYPFQGYRGAPDQFTTPSARLPGMTDLYDLDLYNQHLGADPWGYDALGTLNDVNHITQRLNYLLPARLPRGPDRYPNLQPLLEACLRFDPTDRPDYAQIFARIQASRPTRAMRSSRGRLAMLGFNWADQYRIGSRLARRRPHVRRANERRYVR